MVEREARDTMRASEAGEVKRDEEKEENGENEGMMNFDDLMVEREARDTMIAKSSEIETNGKP